MQRARCNELFLHAVSSDDYIHIFIFFLSNLTSGKLVFCVTRGPRLCLLSCRIVMVTVMLLISSDNWRLHFTRFSFGFTWLCAFSPAAVATASSVVSASSPFLDTSKRSQWPCTSRISIQCCMIKSIYEPELMSFFSNSAMCFKILRYQWWTSGPTVVLRVPCVCLCQ